MRINTTEKKVLEGLELITRNGGSVDYEAQKVSVQGVTVAYGFNRDTEVLTVNILSKPFLATDSMIESKILEYFN